MLEAGGDGLRWLEWSVAEDADTENTTVVAAANPLRTEAEMREQRPRVTEVEWLQFACCRWGVGSARWLPPGAWAACRAVYEVEDEPLVLGVDVGGSRSATAVVGCVAFPRTYTIRRTAGSPPWWNVMQWMSRHNNNRVRPIWRLDVQNTPSGGMRLDLVWWHRHLEGPHPGESGYRRFTQTVAEVPVGRWFKVTAQLRQYKDFDGALRVWQGGQLLFENTGIRTSFENCDYNAWCGSNEWSLAEGRGAARRARA